MLEQLSPAASSQTPQTVTAQILRAHGVDDITPGAYGLARPDLVLLNEVSGAMALRAFEEMGAERVFDPARVALVIDHFVPAKDTNSAALADALRRFARRHGIDQLWEVGVTTDAGFARIFLRNALNLGLLVVESAGAAAACRDGDHVRIDPEAGVLERLEGGFWPLPPHPPFLQELLAQGGLVPWVRRRLAEAAP